MDFGTIILIVLIVGGFFLMMRSTDRHVKEVSERHRLEIEKEREVSHRYLLEIKELRKTIQQLRDRLS